MASVRLSGECRYAMCYVGRAIRTNPFIDSSSFRAARNPIKTLTIQSAMPHREH